MKDDWVLIVYGIGKHAIDQSPKIYLEDRESTQANLLAQFDYLFEENREREDEGISESGEDAPDK